MKGKKRLSGVLLIVAALIIMQLPVSEADAATSASDFKMEGNTLVKYRGTETNVSIPDTVEIIGEGAFEGNEKIELVVVPNSVKRIDAYAFWGCNNLDTVVLGRGLGEVGDYAFANCKGLKEMSIPTNIRYIGIQAFADCVNMTDITIPPEVTGIHETAFDGCSKLVIHCETGSVADKYAEDFYERQKEMPEYEDVPGYETPDTAENTGSDVTPGAEETPEAVQTQDPVSQEEGNLLGSTKIVGNQAVVFIDNTSPVVLGGNSSINGEEPDGTITASFQAAEDGSIPKYTIVDGRIVADQAYYRNSALGEVTLPDGIEEIGQFAFSRSSVTSIAVPEGVRRISYGAFYHCDSLETVTLPATVENVEPKAFEHSLWVENFKENGPDDFLISGNVLVAYRGSSEEITIPEGVTLIAAEAFMDNTRLKSVIFPESLLTIGEGAFEGCSNLSDIQWGTGIAKIKDRAFAGCPLSAVSLPASVKEMGLKAFDGGTDVVYSGETPVSTHEISAERLSNEKYRTVEEETAEAGVTVTGISPALAHLEGASRSYTLTVETAEDAAPMQDAYMRRFQNTVPADLTVYDLQLTDNSGIPLTKLGKQILTVTLPLPEALSGENPAVYALDRNGQLEELEAERVLLDGVAAVRFQTTHLSLFAFCGDGSVMDSGGVEEVSTVLQSMSSGPGEQETQSISYMTCLKWVLGGLLLLWGVVNIITKEKDKKL